MGCRRCHRSPWPARGRGGARTGGSAGGRPGSAGVNTVLKWLQDVDDLDVTVGGEVVVRITDMIDGRRTTRRINGVSDGLRVGDGDNDMAVRSLVL